MGVEERPSNIAVRLYIDAPCMSCPLSSYLYVDFISLISTLSLEIVNSIDMRD